MKMNTSMHKSFESKPSNCELNNANIVQIRKKYIATGSNRSLENIFVTAMSDDLGKILGEKEQQHRNANQQHRKKSARKALLDAKRRSKSENELIIQGDFLEMDNEINEFTEKTGDLLLKALKKNKLFEKTELENEQEYNTTDNYNSSSDRDCSENMMMPMPSPQPGVVTDSQGLIVPKKLINPCLESTDRQNLHRELLFNQKIGKNVLNQKSELQRALEKQKERQFLLQQRQLQQQECESGVKGELNRVIMERQQKIEKKNLQIQDEIDNQLNPEYINARAKLRTRVDAK